MTSVPVSAHAPDPSSASAAAVAPARSLAPDVARGLMLALIAVANVSWYLWRSTESVGGTPHLPADGPLDTIAQAVMTIAVDHRAMPLFAFLFGYGMVQFYRSRIDRGLAPGAVRTMMRRRHWAMPLLGARMRRRCSTATSSGCTRSARWCWCGGSSADAPAPCASG
ncbi:hypothetical protein [Brachybacterium sp. GPGPB12]|uniref:hypothetical protein n=1 Tax=Brachybacterium sp. GPGPB12 TaxID=3023517 RepID=UPI0031344FE9